MIEVKTWWGKFQTPWNASPVKAAEDSISELEEKWLNTSYNSRIWKRTFKKQIEDGK